MAIKDFEFLSSTKGTQNLVIHVDCENCAQNWHGCQAVLHTTAGPSREMEQVKMTEHNHAYPPEHNIRAQAPHEAHNRSNPRCTPRDERRCTSIFSWNILVRQTTVSSLLVFAVMGCSVKQYRRRWKTNTISMRTLHMSKSWLV